MNNNQKYSKDEINARKSLLSYSSILLGIEELCLLKETKNPEYLIRLKYLNKQIQEIENNGNITLVKKHHNYELDLNFARELIRQIEEKPININELERDAKEFCNIEERIFPVVKRINSILELD